ncbi:MAG: hypothetical protein ABR915_05265 [Thermoguttaceae bacterium]|jgi:hypothetical protein
MDLFRGELMDGPLLRNSPDCESFVPAIREGLRVLLGAHNYAQDIGCGRWDFAVEIASLHEAGLATSDLRWLVCKNYVEHAREISVPGANGRQFESEGRLTFHRETAFVLTDIGVRVAQRVAEDASRDAFARANGHRPTQGNGVHASTLTDSVPSSSPYPVFAPHWDRDRHELRVGDCLVKVFKLPSPVQESILAAFEEEHWPPRIDDPLSPEAALDSKQRLHDAIKSLNRNQRNRLLRFRGDGTGEGILWEFAAENRARLVVSRAREA